MIIIVCLLFIVHIFLDFSRARLNVMRHPPHVPEDEFDVGAVDLVLARAGFPHGQVGVEADQNEIPRKRLCFDRTQN